MEETKKNYLNYKTERDVIQAYADRRNITYEQSEDLYNGFKKWILFKLNDTSNSPKAGFLYPKFMSFLIKHLNIQDLKKNATNPQYKRAEEQLHHYMSGHQKLKIR